MRSLVTSIFLYACVSWTLTAELQRRIQAMEMRCYPKILLKTVYIRSLLLLISYKDNVANEEVCAKIQQAIGPHKDLLTIVKRRKTAVVWSCLPFIRSDQNHLARHCERGKKTRQTEEEVGRQHREMDRPGVRQVPEGSGEQRKMEETRLWNYLWYPDDSRGLSRLRDRWWDDDVCLYLCVRVCLGILFVQRCLVFHMHCIILSLVFYIIMYTHTHTHTRGAKRLLLWHMKGVEAAE